jgi:peptidoglycan/xylan/chitin deacetylase (PgdA/CDA1 family)
VRNHLTENDIRTLRNDGFEIGSHGNSHRNLLSLTERELENEFSISKKWLENIVGTVNTYAYPYGDSSPYTRKICQRFYDFAFSLYEGGTELSVDGMHIKRYSIDEIYKILNI